MPGARTAPTWLPAARALLAIGYLALSHAATLYDRDPLAALAVFLIAALLLLEPLLLGRAYAWLLLLASAIGLSALAHSAQVRIALLLMPVLFLLLLAWLFGRTLLRGRVPVIGKMVAALEGDPGDGISPELQRYARGLTALWTAVFVALAAVNFVLALLAEPGGLLARLGRASPWPVSDADWSWFANAANYGVVVAVFALEFAYRKRRFPGRYKNALDFGRRMAGLGPAFWRDLFK